MINVVKQVLLFALILAMIDMTWLYGGKSFHQDMVMRVQKTPLNISTRDQYIAAFGFYVLAGLTYVYVIAPLAKCQQMSVMQSGAMVGAAMYFTFDLTNKAIFDNYTWKYVAMDGTWGAFAMGLASFLTNKITNQ
jgi:uncharacterized membrane protein